jgi:hypothetical protein
VCREAWSTVFVIFGLVDVGFLMTGNSAPADSSPEASLAASMIASAAPRQRAALILAGFPQLITVSAMVNADPVLCPGDAGPGTVKLWRAQAYRRRRCEQMTRYPEPGKKAG